MLRAALCDGRRTRVVIAVSRAVLRDCCQFGGVYRQCTPCQVEMIEVNDTMKQSTVRHKDLLRMGASADWRAGQEQGVGGSGDGLIAVR